MKYLSRGSRFMDLLRVSAAGTCGHLPFTTKYWYLNSLLKMSAKRSATSDAITYLYGNGIAI